MNRLSNLAMVKALIVQTKGGILTGDLLDVGCGAKPYARLGLPCSSYTGLDIRPVAEINNDICGWVPDRQYDSVMCIDTLQYVIDPASAIDAMVAALKPGGVLLLVAPNTSAEDEAALWNFKVRGIESLLSRHALRDIEIQAMSKLWEAEFANFRGVDKYGFTFPAEIDGFIGYLDEAYPSWVVATARKA